ncbi:DUF3631 domain-containing protein [Vreelandella alkaliphila]|uniref:DUF3631 domain-containing protein n=1 Tax=Vreelandella alkaliphila TaxID=272774 RepID=UPI003FD8C132
MSQPNIKEVVDNAPEPLKPMDIVQSAIDGALDDPGALFEQSILDHITSIRQNSPADWQRIRAAAKKAKVQVAELDKLTRTLSSGEGGELFPTIEPWQDHVDGAALVRELSDTLRQYVICEPEVADAAALWIAFTWFIDEVHVAPLANITAPLPNCGKSTLLEFLETFAFQPLKCDGISPAALFRSMDKWTPTLLIDEVDTFLRDNEDARGVLNSGHRRNGFIIRVVGEDHEPKRFATWGAKALCGIGSIANTLASRSIRFELRRKLPHETVENIRFMPQSLRDRLKRQFARLHEDLAETVSSARPEPIPGLSNRAADNWEPLQQIAVAIGGEWPERVRRIAMSITRMDDAEQASDVGTELLKDIKEAFEEKGVDRLFSAELVNALHADSEAPWNSWNRGQPITARQVASKLGDFGIKSKQLRIGYETKKGYDRKDFAEAFRRYLSPTTPQQSETTKQTSNHAGYSDIPNETEIHSVSQGKRHEASNHAGCFDVSDKSTRQLASNGEEF